MELGLLAIWQRVRGPESFPGRTELGLLKISLNRVRSGFNPILCASNQLPKTERAERRAVLIATNAVLVRRELSTSGLDSLIT